MKDTKDYIGKTQLTTNSAIFILGKNKLFLEYLIDWGNLVVKFTMGIKLPIGLNKRLDKGVTKKPIIYCIFA